MSDRNQIFLAFFTPLGLAIGLFALRYALWRPVCNDLAFLPDHGYLCLDSTFPVAFYEFWIFIPGLVLLALLMPAFIVTSNYQNRRNKTETPLIFG